MLKTLTRRDGGIEGIPPSLSTPMISKGKSRMQNAACPTASSCDVLHSTLAPSADRRPQVAQRDRIAFMATDVRAKRRLLSRSASTHLNKKCNGSPQIHMYIWPDLVSTCFSRGGIKLLVPIWVRTKLYVRRVPLQGQILKNIENGAK